MKINEELNQLVEKMQPLAGSHDPLDRSSLTALDALLAEIGETVERVTEGSDALHQESQVATAAAQETVAELLKQDIPVTEAMTEAVNASLQTVADLCRELEGAAASEAPDLAPQAIPEEDVALVLDFVAESNEHIELAEVGLLELDKCPDNEDTINLVFRAFHTIKGMAGFLNLQDIGSLAHSAENLLDRSRKGQLLLQGASMDAVFESMDMMKKMIAALKQSAERGELAPAPVGLSDLLARLKACLEGDSPPPATPEDVPAKLDVKQDEQLDQVLEPAQPSNVKIKYGKGKPQTSDEKIKVSTTRLDTLIDTVGELVIANLMVAEEVKDRLATEHVLGAKVSHLSKIVRELQELSMSMRMVPVQGVFHRMTRLVRDLGRKSGKDIQFSTRGEDTELDRTVVDKIADPLVHMIRNSVDHGIEPADDRQKAGKALAGGIQLRAFHKAGHVVIEIEDDGKGLDRDRILQKAIDNGVVSPEQDLSDEEIYRLVFHAGLSTAKQVTDISGRGVGMDVVKKNIEELQGRVDICSRPGEGTVFTICLPLTLAIIDGQIVKVGSERYIIPINSIVNSFRPQPEQVSSVNGTGEVIHMRGELMPLVRLHKIFGVTPTAQCPEDALLMIVEADASRCCLLVDELLGQQQVVIKNLGVGLGTVPGVSGGAIMGDGLVSLILDVPGLVDLAQH